MPSVEAIGLIAIPVLLALISFVYGGVKIAVRLGQFLSTTEAAQVANAQSNHRIAESLDKYAEKTDRRLEIHDRRLTRVETVVGVSDRD